MQSGNGPRDNPAKCLPVAWVEHSETLVRFDGSRVALASRGYCSCKRELQAVAMADSLPVFCAVVMVEQKEEVKRIRLQDSGRAVRY